ncbi:ABC transporter permease, partial [Rhizobium ruizarguesonis]
AVNGRDAPLLMGIVFTSAVLVISVNFLVDLVYASLDPRIGASEGGA